MQTATIHISVMTGKLDGLRAISTNTRTNDYCIKQNASGDPDNICTKCYSHTMLSSYRAQETEHRVALTRSRCGARIQQLWSFLHEPCPLMV